MKTATLEKTVSAEASEPPVGSSGPEGLGYTLWRFDGNQWKIKKDCAAEGAVASLPPTIPGEFEGQLRATACVLAT